MNSLFFPIPLNKLMLSVRIKNPLNTAMIQSVANLAVIADTSVVNILSNPNIITPNIRINIADVGFAMQAGSDVAKEAGDIILTDNNFASVVKGIELGRTFMHNIMMFLEFQLPINISLLIMSMLYPVISGGSPFLAAVQILIINIIMDSLNSLSFGGEPPKEEYMKEKPLRKGSGLFINGAMARILSTTAMFILIFGVIIFGFDNIYKTKLCIW